ncbi:hypothetical protein PIB30_016134 [Stylosanthes scabra]|uniref:Uncharacterized protein n=1 Tax=Stylosanthes scabra TaxID=79078 RepID=A0ABU6S7J7_9FABA|nr:hypothetical protein [Stylosanthes scabra]
MKNNHDYAHRYNDVVRRGIFLSYGGRRWLACWENDEKETGKRVPIVVEGAKKSEIRAGTRDRGGDGSQ